MSVVAQLLADHKLPMTFYPVTVLGVLVTIDAAVALSR
jgi:hypothetical protein